jgi:hypothetical protein
MDRVTRCLHCGKRMVPAPSLTGRTELICVYCDKPDTIEVVQAASRTDVPSARAASSLR